MKQKNNEKGQALIIIALGAVVLIGFAALAIDGSRVFEDKRHAQNAADTSSLAGALAYSRATNPTDAAATTAEIETAAFARATENGYDNSNANQTVTVQIDTVPNDGTCPTNRTSKTITVTINSTIDTTFGRVLGRDTMSSTSLAVAKACGFYAGPPFDGNAIVSLSKTGTAIGGNGNVNIDITGGGFFSNSTGNPSVDCDGNAGSLNVPSVSIATGGNYDYGNCSTTIPGGTTTTAKQYSDKDSMEAFFPRSPTCDGAAYPSGGTWYPEAAKDGSKVTWSGDMNFAPGLYCIINSPGNFSGVITGDEVTFYSSLSNFKLAFLGGGYFSATAPSSGEYKGVLVYLQEYYDINGNLLHDQTFELYGEGTASTKGAIIAPSAVVTINGNPFGGAYQSQIISYNVTIGGTADVIVQYDPNVTYQATVPYTLQLLE